MILVTGATGFLGKRVCRKLEARGLEFTRTSLSLGADLRDAARTKELFAQVRPSVVLNCAAFVGGIQFGYQHAVSLFRNNLQMTLNLLESASETGVRRFVNPISNCAYPGRLTLFREDEFWDGPLHESVMVYGFVRKAFWIGSWAYQRERGLDVLNLILSNMYGPEDHFDDVRSHALGALVKKFLKAKRNGEPYVTVWGTGTPVREWLYVDDGAEAMIRAIDAPPHVDPVNVGVGEGVSIADLATMIKSDVGYAGEIRFDPSKPDGAKHKTVDGQRGRALLRWSPEVDLRSGVRTTVRWLEENYARIVHD